MNSGVIKVPLEQLLENRRKSIYALAKETGIAYTTLWKMKEGKTQSINFEVLEKVCANLKCTPNDLLIIISEKD